MLKAAANRALDCKIESFKKKQLTDSCLTLNNFYFRRDNLQPYPLPFCSYSLNVSLHSCFLLCPVFYSFLIAVCQTTNGAHMPPIGMECGTKWLHYMYFSGFASVKVSIKVLKSPSFFLPVILFLCTALTDSQKRERDSESPAAG